MIPQWLTQDHANLRFSRLLVVKDPNIIIVCPSIWWYIIVVGPPPCAPCQGYVVGESALVWPIMQRCLRVLITCLMKDSVRVGGSMRGTLNFLLRVIFCVKHGHLIPERTNPTARKTWTLTHHNFEKSSCMQDIHDRLGAASKSGKKSLVTQFRDSMKGLVFSGRLWPTLADMAHQGRDLYKRSWDAEDRPCILPG